MLGLRIKNRKGWRRLLGMFCVAALVLPLSVKAEEQKLIMQVAVDGNKAQLYIRGVDVYEEAAAQVGMEVAEITETADVASMHTIILVDNSLSITEENQRKIQEFLTEYVGQKADMEKISVAVFGEEVEYLVKEEMDAADIEAALGQITYRNQDSYLTDILYDEILSLTELTEYTRFIVVTDGVDNKEIGYTKEELQELLKKKNYPVYALGCTYKNNSMELENLFSIARLTHGRYFLLDDYKEYTEIINGFGEPIGRVEIGIPTECRDGSEKSILLSLETEEGTLEMTARAVMPFQVREQKETEAEKEAENVPIPEEPSTEQTEAEPPAPEAVAAAEETESEEAGDMDMMTVGAIILAVAAVIVLIVYQMIGKKKARQKKGEKEENAESLPMEKPLQQEAEHPYPVSDAVAEEPVEETVMLNEEGTIILGQNRNTEIVMLTDKRDSTKVFRYPIGEGVVIGRKNMEGVHIVLNYDSSVSAKHCKITAFNGHYFIEDLHSSNKTYLNDEEVEGRWEFIPGSMVRLGRVEMIVDVLKKE